MYDMLRLYPEFIDPSVLAALTLPTTEPLALEVRQSVFQALVWLYLSTEPLRREPAPATPKNADPPQWPFIYRVDDIQACNRTTLRIEVLRPISAALKSTGLRSIYYDASWNPPIRVEVEESYVETARRIIDSIVAPDGGIPPRTLIEVVACRDRSRLATRKNEEAQDCGVE